MITPAVITVFLLIFIYAQNKITKKIGVSIELSVNNFG